MATDRTTGPKNNETLFAIIGAALIAVVLASILTTNPFRALRMGYGDYTSERPAVAALAPAKPDQK